MQPIDWYRERRGQASLSGADKNTIIADYNAATGGNFYTDFKPACPNRYSDAIDKIILTMANKDNSGYVLKRGVAFRYKGKMITRANITKEAAEWHIAQNLDNRNDFEVLAKDWDEYANA